MKTHRIVVRCYDIKKIDAGNIQRSVLGALERTCNEFVSCMIHLKPGIKVCNRFKMYRNDTTQGIMCEARIFKRQESLVVDETLLGFMWSDEIQEWDLAGIQIDSIKSLTVYKSEVRPYTDGYVDRTTEELFEMPLCTLEKTAKEEGWPDNVLHLFRLPREELLHNMDGYNGLVDS